MKKYTEVVISVQDKEGNSKQAILAISKSPVLMSEIGYITNEIGQVIFNCEQGEYEFTAHGDNEKKGKVQVLVQGYKLICANIVID